MVRVRLSVQLHPSAPHGGRFTRASAVQREARFQPGEAMGNAAAQSCIFLIDYQHSNMMHSVTSVFLCACCLPGGLSLSLSVSLSLSLSVCLSFTTPCHHSRPHVREALAAAGGSPVHLIPCQSKKKKLKSKSVFRPSQRQCLPVPVVAWVDGGSQAPTLWTSPWRKLESSKNGITKSGERRLRML